MLDNGAAASLQHIDILCLSETRHRSENALLAAFPFHIIFHKPAAQSVQGQGVAILVHKRFCPYVQELSSPCPSMQFVAVRLLPPAVPMPCVVVHCYIPPTGSPQLQHTNMRDQYMHLTTFMQTHAHAARVLGGDLNAHVQFAHASAIAGRNDSGVHLLDLVAACDLQFALKHDDSQPATFSTYRAGRLVTSSPDHIVASCNFPASLSPRVCSDVVGSDHVPVAVHIHWHGFYFHSAPLPLTPHMRLRWQGCREAFTAALTHMLSRGAGDDALHLLTSGGVHAAMDALVDLVLFAAVKSDHVLGAPRSHRTQVPLTLDRSHQPWFDGQCRSLRECYRQCLRQHGHGHHLTRVAHNRYKAACRALKAQTKPAPFAACAADVDACVAYFSRLFYRQDLPANTTAPGFLADQHDHALNQPFSHQEVLDALSSLRNGAACGPDGVPAEFYKYAHNGTGSDHLLAEYLTAVFNAMFGEGSTPPCWGQALLTLIYKGGGRVATRLSTWAEAHQVHTPLHIRTRGRRLARFPLP